MISSVHFLIIFPLMGNTINKWLVVRYINIHNCGASRYVLPLDLSISLKIHNYYKKPNAHPVCLQKQFVTQGRQHPSHFMRTKFPSTRIFTYRLWRTRCRRRHSFSIQGDRVHIAVPVRKTITNSKKNKLLFWIGPSVC